MRQIIPGLYHCLGDGRLVVIALELIESGEEAAIGSYPPQKPDGDRVAMSRYQVGPCKALAAIDEFNLRGKI